MVADGECLPRHSAMLSMSWHPELTTGAVAARFFEGIVQRLQRGLAESLLEQQAEVIPGLFPRRLRNGGQRIRKRAPHPNRGTNPVDEFRSSVLNWRAR
jgi:hypothetical protein